VLLWQLWHRSVADGRAFRPERSRAAGSSPVRWMISCSISGSFDCNRSFWCVRRKRHHWGARPPRSDPGPRIVEGRKAAGQPYTARQVQRDGQRWRAGRQPGDRQRGSNRCQGRQRLQRPARNRMRQVFSRDSTETGGQSVNRTPKPTGIASQGLTTEGAVRRSIIGAMNWSNSK
jgi:hypothetical protein